MVSETLLKKAEEFHGHICPFLTLGLRASELAMQKVGLVKAGLSESVGEEILAIVECNNCFSDGVQIATGCTFGNNSLIYLDVGKNAVTLVRRGSWRGVRVYVDAEKIRSRYFTKEALDLFEKVVTKREGSRDDIERLREIWSQIGRSMLTIPEEEFKIDAVEVAEIERAPIFESVKCAECGELVMSTRIQYVDGRAVCLSCLGVCAAVVGRGIVPDFRVPLMRGR
jgi:formylmethanofuran dehydrogenase subunit E